MMRAEKNENSESDLNFESCISRICESLRACIAARLTKWKPNAENREVREVVGALLARNATLAEQLILSPGIWNPHIGPIVLRCMSDVHISLAWILRDPVKRSRLFVLHGLGQEKLIHEHRLEQLRRDGKDPNQDPVIAEQKAWIDSQQFTFLTEVNIGSWSGIDTRKMAEEADCLDFYRYVFSPLSPAVHSTWNFVCRHNARPCKNPLHIRHFTPFFPRPEPSLLFVLRCLDCVERTLSLFDKHLPLGIDAADLSKLGHDLLARIHDDAASECDTIHAPSREV